MRTCAASCPSWRSGCAPPWNASKCSRQRSKRPRRAPCATASATSTKWTASRRRCARRTWRGAATPLRSPSRSAPDSTRTRRRRRPFRAALRRPAVLRPKPPPCRGASSPEVLRTEPKARRRRSRHRRPCCFLFFVFFCKWFIFGFDQVHQDVPPFPPVSSGKNGEKNSGEAFRRGTGDRTVSSPHMRLVFFVHAPYLENSALPPLLLPSLFHPPPTKSIKAIHIQPLDAANEVTACESR